MSADVLLVSLGATAGLRASDEALAAALGRAGAEVRIATAAPQRDVRTLALTDLLWARAARAAATDALAREHVRAVLYSTITAALLWPRPGAIRFDALAAANRPGRHGIWQRPLERRRLRAAPLLVPVDEGSLLGAPAGAAAALVIPIAVAGPAQASSGARDIAAITYATNPHKKGLDRVLGAWGQARRPDEELVVAGIDEAPGEGVRAVGRLEPAAYRALVRRARVFIAAPRWEDYGIAQLEALADGCRLVSTPAPGPYPALELARRLDARFVSDDLAGALRCALDDSDGGYPARAQAELERFSPATVDRIVAERLLPELVSAGPA